MTRRTILLAVVCLAATASAHAQNDVVVFSDDFENGNAQGWTLPGPDSTATEGNWVFGDPLGTNNGFDEAQPEDPFAGNSCAFTGQNISLAIGDVDDGVTYLVSPVIKLAGLTSAELDYVRWYYLRDLNQDFLDFFTVDVRESPTAPWINVEMLSITAAANSWTPRTVNLHDFIPLTNRVQIRFGASDGPGRDNVLEAAVDNVTVRAVNVLACTSDATCDDQNPCNGEELCDLQFGFCREGSCKPPASCPCCPGGIPLDCEDGNPCTIDDCNEGICTHVPDVDAACDDDNSCTDDDTCDEDSLCAGTPLNCNDNNPCTIDACNDGACTHVPDVDAACDDGNSCTDDDTCDEDGLCAGTPLDCSDNNPCTNDSCFAGTCLNVNNNNTCDDNDLCTLDDTCFNGVCVGQPVNCDDGNECTDDACSAGSCLNLPDAGAACDDADACTTSDACDDAGNCVGAPLDCDDNNPCTADFCANGACTSAPDPGAACNDGNPCTTADTCNADASCSGTPLDCDDNNPCTSDACTDGACVNEVNIGATCNDGDFCTENDVCAADGTCTGISIICDDSNVCTDDLCFAGSCINVNNSIGCNDDDLCTVNDTCAGGACLGTPLDCSDDNPCTNDLCFAGTCVNVNSADACNDDDLCTLNDACFNGVCLGNPIDCNDDDDCTVDTCADGICVNTLDVNSPCDDGDGCTENDVCNPDGTCGGAPTDCDDGNECTDDICSNGNCRNDFNTAPCNDGDLCTLDDTCAAGACLGTPILCEDDNPCTDDSCELGVCRFLRNTNPCDDGNACTADDVCFAGECNGTPVDCDDANPCTIDACTNGACLNTPNDNAPCDDDDACTIDDTCADGVCLGQNRNCDDANPCTNDGCDPLTGCFNDANTNPCEDDLFCNGAEQCADGTCQPGNEPCADADQVCNETQDRCEADCNQNGVPDDVDIASDVSLDNNRNGIPDECEFGIRFVDDDAPPGGNGRSWTNAFRDLQQALAAADDPEEMITEIRVAQGTYRPTDNGDITARFQLRNNLRVNGGYAGLIATQPNARNVDNFPAILSGDLNDDDTPQGGNRADNTLNLLGANAVDESAVLDGFVIQHGGQAGSNGGGASIVLASPTLIRCTFQVCTGAIGGAVTLSNASARFVNCRFLGNTSSNDGGAVRDAGDSTFVNCLFSGNHAGRDGGAISSLNGSTRFLNCTFVGNTANRVGGAMRITQSGITVNGCLLWDNSDVTGNNESAQLSADAPVSIDYCNVLGWTGNLGGIGNFGDDPLLANPLGPDNQYGTSDDDVALLPASPCINTGDLVTSNLPAVDLAGNLRVQRCRVDVGAVESPFFNNDCNANGSADACDIASGDSTDLNANDVPDDCEDCVTDEDCSDGVFCNGQEQCVGIFCEPPTANPCDAAELCDETNDTCVAYGNGDFDDDGDADLADFAGMQACFGQSVFQNTACQPANLGGDEMIDAVDVALLIQIFTGP